MVKKIFEGRKIMKKTDIEEKSQKDNIEDKMSKEIFSMGKIVYKDKRQRKPSKSEKCKKNWYLRKMMTLGN